MNGKRWEHLLLYAWVKTIVTHNIFVQFKIN